jgi:four helix bundle protein
MKENIILDKSYKFSIDIVLLYKNLTKVRKEFVLSKQILRSGTSIGANVEEAVGGYSRKEFLNKMTIAYKEARETLFWLRLLTDTNFIEVNQSIDLQNKCKEIIRILTKIQLTMKSVSKNISN